MKLYYLSVLYKGDDDAKALKAAQDLSNFGFFQRKSVEEFMVFTSKILVQRSELCSRSTVQEQEYFAHVFIRSDSLAGVIISDAEYPKRVAHTLLNKVLSEFEEKVPRNQWPTADSSAINFTSLPTYLAKYQNPSEADGMMKLQNDLDETKIILHKTIEAVLQRGEKLDDLVAKSDDLSLQSRAFYKTAKKTNACCKWG